MLLNGLEFLDRSGHSLIRVGATQGPHKLIRLEIDEKVIGVKAIADPDGRLYEVKFKIARLI